MKKIIYGFAFALLVVQTQAKADSAPADRLNGMTAQFFCNALNKVLHQPEISTSCIAIIETDNSPFNIEAINRGEFGVVQKEWTLKDSHDVYEYRNGDLIHVELPPSVNILMIISTVTVQQLEALRFNSGIHAIAPDMPLGGTGGISSAGGGQ